MDIANLAELFKNNSVIIYPAETLFGIGCRYPSEIAMKKIQQIKERPLEKSFIVLMKNQLMVEEWCLSENRNIEFLFKKIWPAHVTAILSLKNGGTLGIRVNNSPFLDEIFKYIDFPLVSTSVNKSGEAPLNNLNEIKEQFEGSVDYIVNQYPPMEGIASTIIDLTGGKLSLIRKGAFPFTSIQEAYDEFFKGSN
ncbi:Sua5/YciO/YrdC/YwlC family protein [bacterium]|nr:Sua5/YciO/YrdC/YwlC family protein [bacterium]